MGPYNYFSYNYIDSGISTAIHYIYPALVIFGCAIVFRTRLIPKQIVCAVVGLMGIIVFYLPGRSGAVSVFGIMLALASGVVYSLYVVFASHPALRNFDTFRLVYCITLVCGTIEAIIVLVIGRLAIPHSFAMWVLFILFAVVTHMLCFFMFQSGIQLIGPQRTSILSMLEPMTSVIAGWIVLKEACTWYSILGCIMILGSILVLSLTGGPLKISKEQDVNT